MPLPPFHGVIHVGKSATRKLAMNWGRITGQSSSITGDGGDVLLRLRMGYKRKKESKKVRKRERTKISDQSRKEKSHFHCENQ